MARLHNIANMNSSKASLSFFLVFTLLSTLCYEIEPAAFHYYILATQWTPTFCRFNPCIPNVPTGLLIHGLWPSNITGNQPRNCNGADKFNYQNVISLEPRLSNSWPDLLGSPPSQQFWADQWEKHGTCSGLSQFDYFDKALKVFRDISPMKGLLGISNAYRQGKWFIPTNLVNDWGHGFGYFPKITCRFDRLGGYELFFELHYNVSVAWNDGIHPMVSFSHNQSSMSTIEILA